MIIYSDLNGTLVVCGIEKKVALLRLPLVSMILSK